ncbi:uncharacterized protein At3g28850-like [Cynara cardunculus var. scolymus]|uniref:uncharacterized protein At3g28850-like n=1 Tax=Cynara cardunculus var. scolymus TaxID=59895 RepID=UPI000D6260C0|nr:uncharacterized protein At3g28850-like [Cynara cardunculus var. scolymus]
MGCSPSKQSVCRNCQAQCSPARRSSSAHAHRSPPREENHHVVALTSTTLGYLLLDSSKQNQNSKDYQEPVRRNAPEKNRKDFAVGVIEAKTWSKMIDEKVARISPKTPIETPPGEPETINAWELMQGLDDTSPLRPPSAIDHIRCFSFNVNSNSIAPHLDEPTFVSEEKHRDTERLSKPIWLQIVENRSDSNSNSNDTCIASDFDPDSIAALRNSFEILPPTNPYHPKPLIEEKHPSSETKKSLQNGKSEKLILYFTSLRGVRKTYEDCCHVRVILKNSGVRVDERDVSMHSGFREELKELLGDRYGCGGLPKVFVGKKYVGGADEIRRLHDEFQLERVLEGCEMANDGGDGCGGRGGCEACGDIKFFPCETCSGSCKIYYEVNSDDGEKGDQENNYGFQRCPDCNENGLIRCPICCD